MSYCSVDPEYPDYEKFSDREEKICTTFESHVTIIKKEEIEDGKRD